MTTKVFMEWVMVGCLAMGAVGYTVIVLRDMWRGD